MLGQDLLLHWLHHWGVDGARIGHLRGSDSAEPSPMRNSVSERSMLKIQPRYGRIRERKSPPKLDNMVGEGRCGWGNGLLPSTIREGGGDNGDGRSSWRPNNRNRIGIGRTRDATEEKRSKRKWGGGGRGGHHHRHGRSCPHSWDASRPILPCLARFDCCCSCRSQILVGR